MSSAGRGLILQKPASVESPTGRTPHHVFCFIDSCCFDSAPASLLPAGVPAGPRAWVLGWDVGAVARGFGLGALLAKLAPGGRGAT